MRINVAEGSPNLTICRKNAMEKTKNSVTAIIVTHNSEDFVSTCLERLSVQTHLPAETIIVDSGSDDTEYLKKIGNRYDVTVIFQPNIGFASANNLGFTSRKRATEFTLFLNPDTFLAENFIENGIAKMRSKTQVGMISGRLLGFDPGKNMATGKIDSTGIFRKAYGRWYDRSHNEKDHGQYIEDEEVPALCGALLLCREGALNQLEGKVFDPDFFLYKEDIELSLRLREKGWSLLYCGNLEAFHCRGWRKRGEIPYALKKTAAESEILLYKKHPSPYIIWALFKYFSVVIFRI